MLIKYIFLAMVGLFGGGLIASGYFALLTSIGIITRYAEETHTGKHIEKYESVLMAGAILGNFVFIFDINLPGGWIFLALYGLGSGIFVGCLVIALAEVLKSVPIFFRRIKLGIGLSYILIFFALGKGIGDLLYFIYRIGEKT